MYDPKAHGAKCHLCPLNGQDVVPPEKGANINDITLLTGSPVAIVGEAPGEQEERNGRAFVGPNGNELNKALHMAGIDRRNTFSTYTMLCRPPKNRLRDFLKKISKYNKELEKAYKKEIKESVQKGAPHPDVPEYIPSPVDCCRPRLEKEMEPYVNFITLGGTATKAVTGAKASLMKLRGGLMHLEATERTPERKVMPTMHPSFCARQPRWYHVFRNDVFKAGRWFRGESEWKPPAIIRQPNLAQLQEFFARHRGVVLSFDLETDGIEPLTANIRCISIGTAEEAVVISLLSNDRVTKFYPPHEEMQLIKCMSAYFEDESQTKFSWNGITYDSAILRARWDCEVNNHIDGILLHRSVESELPHGLGYVGSMYTDAPSWKTNREGGKLATQSESDEELATYCLFEGTTVFLGDGSRAKIETLVRAKYDGDVLSMTESGVIEPRKVTGWHYTLAPDVDWRQVTFVGQRERERGLILTADHSLGTTRGWVEAQDLVPGDEVYDAEPRFGADELAAVCGTVLGDTILVASPSQRSLGVCEARSLALAGGHAAASGVAAWKEKELWFFQQGSVQPSHPVKVNGRAGVRGPFVPLSSPCLRQLAELSSRLYDEEGRRRLWPSTLSYMGPRGLAWLYVDDGCKQKRTKARSRGWKSQETMVFAVQGFCREDIDAAVNWFRENYGPTVAGADGVIRVGAVASRKLARAIAPYVPPVARYKLPHIEGVSWASVAYVPVASSAEEASVRTVQSVQPYSHVVRGKNESRRVASYRARRRYCLDVEGNHNFFTSYGLVHNCAFDVGVTARVMAPLVEQIQLRNQVEVFKSDSKIQHVCRAMHQVGMHVDQAKRLEVEKTLMKRRYDLLIELRAHLNNSSFNPGSVYQVRDILFDKWGLEAPLDDKERLTASDDPSTADVVLRALLTDRTVSKDQRHFIKLLRYYRKVQKVLGTYVLKLRPWDMFIDEGSDDGGMVGWDDEEDWVDKETRKRFGERKRGIVNPRTGRMYPGWSASVAVCVTPDTWLITEGGPRQIGRIPGFGGSQTESPVKGLSLHDGEDFGVVSHLQNPGVCFTLRVQTVLGFDLTATPHHRIRVALDRKGNKTRTHGSFVSLSRRDATGKRERKERQPESGWCRMDELEKGMYVKIPIGMEVWGTETRVPTVLRLPKQTNANEVWLPSVLDEDLAFFMGVYNADGSLHDSNGSFQIRIADTKQSMRGEEVEEVAIRLFGPAAVSRSREGLAVTSVSLRTWCEAFGLGRGIENKRAPDWILSAPRRFVVSYLRGLFFDSHVYPQSKTGFMWKYTGSRELAKEVQMFLLNMGVPASLADLRTPKQPRTWACLVGGPDVSAVLAIQGKELPPAPQALRVPSRNFTRRGNTLWVRVRSVEEAGEQQVLDVTIPSTHQFWANGTVSHNTGRLSSSKPINAMNFPHVLRGLVTCQPGNVLVGADADQLEIRVAAAIWQIEKYLLAFREGKDPHSMTAFLIFEEAFCKAAGITADQFSRPGILVGSAYDENGVFTGKGESKSLRSLSKGVHFASQYMAGVERVHKMIQSAETPNDDGTTDLPYALLQLRRVRQMHDKWLAGAPEYAIGWERDINEWKNQGYLLDPVGGRRRDFLDSHGGEEAVNELVNFKVQCIPGHVRVLTQEGYIPIRELQGRKFTAWTGKKWAEATAVCKGPAKLRRVKTDHALSLVCDESHKLKVPMRSQYDWRRADELEPKTRVALDMARPHEFGVSIGTENAYMLGLWLADGSASRKKGNRGVEVRFAVGDSTVSGRSQRAGGEQVARVSRYIRVDLGLLVQVSPQEGCTNVGFSKGAREWCLDWGLDTAWTSHTKRVPEVIWRSSLACRKEFLRGFLDGDGHQDKVKGVFLHLCNPALLEELALLFRTTGVDATNLEGPYKQGEHTSWRLRLAAAHVHKELQWGKPGKYRTNQTAPQFECARVQDRLQPQTPSHRTIKSRIKGHKGATSPYTLAGMLEDVDLYDHGHVKSSSDLGITADVFTLSVNDPEHCYVANGFISKNSGAAAWMNKALIEIYEQIPENKWGPGTGIINQCHDHIVVECPEHAAAWVAGVIEEAMNGEHAGLPGVKLTASADIGPSWDKV